MNVSVIIPIYNAEKYLNDFFDYISKNDFIDGDEVLLVDNGSTDNSKKMCLDMCKKNPGLFNYLLYTEKASSYSARNYGVKKSKNSILIFTDSDTKPCKNWIKCIRENTKENQIIAGKIVLEVINGDLWEVFDKIAHLNSEETFKNHSVATANMSVLKKDFIKVGEFEDRFSGGDYEWSQRANKKGFNIVFLEKALVYHPTRKSFDAILKKEQRIAYGQGNHHANNKKRMISLIIKFFLKIFKIDTNIRYSRQLKKEGISTKNIILFNLYFFKIRLGQLKYAIKGYKKENVRTLGLK